MSIWCEHCRDHFDREHYADDGSRHLVGANFGPTGAAMEREDRYRTALEQIHLIARGQVTQYARARQQVEQIARDALS